MKNRTNRITAALSTAGACLLALATAPAAEADPDGYLRSLENGGLTVYDRTAAVQTGYVVCQTLDEFDAESVAWALADMSEGDFTLYDTRVIVRSASTQLCPWHSGIPSDPAPRGPRKERAI